MDYIFLALVLLCGFFDIKTRKIPNKITIPLVLIFFTYQTIQGNILMSLLGIMVSFSIGLICFLMKGMGGGDVKLMAAMGAYLGVIPFLNVLFLASIIGVIWGIAIFAKNKVLGQKVKAIKTKLSLIHFHALDVTEFVQNDKEEIKTKPHLAIPFGTCLGLAMLCMTIFPIQFFIF